MAVSKTTPGMRSVLLTICLSALTVLADLQNVAVERLVDITKAYPKITAAIEVLNADDTPQNVYTYLLPKHEFENLAVFSAKDAVRNELEFKVSSGEYTEVRGHEFREVYISLPEPIHKDEKYKLKVYIALSEGNVPYPKTGKQSDAQQVLFETYKHVVSKYATSSEKLRVRVASTAVTELVSGADYTPNEKNLLAFDSVDVEPLNTEMVKLLYNYPMPIPQILNLNRTVTVSHILNKLRFDESYDLYNAGTKLVGEFSHLDMTRNPRLGLNAAAIQRMILPLPANHTDEYFIDLVGNVSTSHLTKEILDLRPRFPLLGGWHYNFTAGFSVPLPDFLRENRGNLILKVPVVGAPENIAVKHLENRIVLPRGAYNVEAYDDLGSHVTVLNQNVGLFDWRSSPVVKVTIDNVVNDHRDTHIFVTYKYSFLMALRAPVSAALVVCGTVLLWSFVQRLL